MKGYIDEYEQPRFSISVNFFGSVKFGQETKDVGIVLTESEDALIGTGMLSEHILKIDFIRKEIEIE